MVASDHGRRRGECDRDRLRPKLRRDAANMGNPRPSPMVEGGRVKRGADSTAPRPNRRKDCASASKRDPTVCQGLDLPMRIPVSVGSRP